MMVAEVWFEIQKDADGFPASRDHEGLLCAICDDCGELAYVESVPFYLKEVAPGDLIRIKQNSGGYLEFNGVESHSGCSVYRLLLHDMSRLEEVQKKLLGFRVILERDDNLIAVAAPSDVNLESLVSYILEGRRSGLWGSQDGFIANEE